MDRSDTREIIYPLLLSGHKSTEYAKDYLYKIEHYSKGDLLVIDDAAMSVEMFVEVIQKVFPGVLLQNLIVHSFGCKDGQIKVQKDKY